MNIIREESSVVEQEAYASITNIYNRIISNLKKHDNGLYRVLSQFQHTSNDALTLGYNGVSYSGSTYSKSLHSYRYVTWNKVFYYTTR